MENTFTEGQRDHMKEKKTIVDDFEELENLLGLSM